MCKCRHTCMHTNTHTRIFNSRDDECLYNRFQNKSLDVFYFLTFCFLSFQVSFSESGSLGNSSGSDVTSLSSQLPDTPNSMVPSPVETWNGALRPVGPPPLQVQLQHDPGPLHVTSSSHRPKIQRGECFYSLTWRGDWSKKEPIDSEFLEISVTKISRTDVVAWLDMEREDVQKTSRWIYSYNKPSFRKQIGNISTSKQMDILRFHCDHIVSCFFNMRIFFFDTFIALSSPVDSCLCLKVRAW